MAAAFAATAVLGTALHTKDKPATVLGRPSVALVARAFPYTAPIAESAVPVMPPTPTEVVLENGITIHNSGSETMEALINEYPSL